MEIDACYRLGHVIKPHGINGRVKIYLDVDTPAKYQQLESVFVEEKQKLVPFFIESIQINGNQALVKFEEVDNIDQAALLKGNGLFLPLDLLDSPGKEVSYLHELIGFSVIDSHHGKLGTIINVQSTPGQDLLIMEYEGKEVMIPRNKDIIREISKDENNLYTTLPHGLLELYKE